MKPYCRGTIAADNLRAKTGSMTGIKSYTGYVTNRAGEELVFTIIANNYTCKSSIIKKKLEKLMVLIAALD